MSFTISRRSSVCVVVLVAGAVTLACGGDRSDGSAAKTGAASSAPQPGPDPTDPAPMNPAPMNTAPMNTAPTNTAQPDDVDMAPLPMEPTAERPTMTRDECTAAGGVITGDIGNGAIHRPDYVCAGNGQPPIATVVPADTEPFALEGEVCCGGKATSDDGSDCANIQCLRAIECVASCGGEVVQSGCCPCPAGTLDSIECTK